MGRVNAQRFLEYKKVEVIGIKGQKMDFSECKGMVINSEQSASKLSKSIRSRKLNEYKLGCTEENFQ